ncbi:unnamed protein product [Rotaria sordida]|uniref:Uncharacterized protein n=1 Tax=Rotaria sordida TaxID=392033 RepID=A0A813VKB5_9BILA|nr:unnamed protein product [Rotaria sordida]CAF1311020.1 unnamed protein product [Rotaria sordida]
MKNSALTISAVGVLKIILQRRTVLVQRDKTCCQCGEDLLAGQFAIKVVYWSGGLDNEESLCLSDYYTIFRCDVLKRPKKSLKSLNPLSWGSGTIKQKNKKIINEQ